MKLYGTSFATLLLLGLHSGWITEKEIEDSSDVRYGYDLMQDAMKKLSAWCSNHALQLCTPDWLRDEQHLLYMSINYEHDVSYYSTEENSLSIEAGCFVDTEIDLNNVPSEVAEATFIALRLIQQELFYFLMEDAWKYTTHFDYDETSDLVEKAIKDTQLQDPEKLLEYFIANEDDYGYLFDIPETPEQAVELLDHMRTIYKANDPDWLTSAKTLEKRSPQYRCKHLLTLLWKWRKESPELYRHPFTSFIRKSAGQVRKLKKCKKQNLEYCEPGEEHPLEYAFGVCIGLPYEESCYEDNRNHINQVGEPMRCGLVLKSNSVREIHNRLQRMFKGIGLLFLFEQQSSKAKLYSLTT